jgi:hypothetical protein
MVQSGIMNYKGFCNRCRTMLKKYIFTFIDSILLGEGVTKLIGEAM